MDESAYLRTLTGSPRDHATRDNHIVKTTSAKMMSDPVAAGMAALSCGDWAQARAHFEAALGAFISPKTVEHHVSRTLSKLGLRTRAEAMAWALRNPSQKSGTK